MDFTEHIVSYYNTESKHGFTGGILSGIVLIIAGVLIWWFSNHQTISKGLSIIFLIAGLIFGLGGYYAASSAKISLPGKIQLYQTDKNRFIDQEFDKVEKIHKSWTGRKIFWTMFIVVGLILIFTTSEPFWTGVAIGSLIVGTLGHIEETVSMKHNEKYRVEVLQLESGNH